MPKKSQNALPLLLLVLLISVGLKYHFMDNFNIDRRGDEAVYATLAEKMSNFDYTTAIIELAMF